jgi:3-oxoacyl-[acyl-carrier-protein] synthase I
VNGGMAVVATGLVCPVGLTTVSACAAIRAKVARFNDLPYFDDQGEPIVGAVVPGLKADLNRRERLVELLVWALRDCLESGGIERTDRMPLLVGLAEPSDSGASTILPVDIVRDVEARLQLRFDAQRSIALPKGHTSAFEALRLARTMLQDSTVSACLVCGVDSCINAGTLWWLDRHRRLKTAGNSDGVIPGEAAAAVLLVRDTDGSGRAAAHVVGLGFSHEDAGVLSEEPLLGLGLAAATRSALTEASLGLHEIDFRLSDVTGEDYGFREQALVLARVLRSRREDFTFWHTADSLGDIGAAAGACQLVVAREAFRKGYAPGNRVICFTSAVSGGRAVAIVEGSGSARPTAPMR